MKLQFLSLCVLAAVSSNVAAEEASDKKPKEQKTWDITSEVGAIVTSGNTETTTLKGALKAKHNLENWRNEYKLDGIYKEDEIENDDGERVSERTNEKYSVSMQGNYKLNEDHSHLFIYGAYDSDYFGAYRSETVLSVGYGLRLLNLDNMYLDAEIGPGMKRFEYQEDSTELDKNGNPLAGTTESEVIGVAKVDFEWQVSDNARFTQVVGVEYGDTNTKTTSESALLTKINGSLQMKVAYNITHNSTVDEGKENTDTETSLTLVYSF
jgi:putative salt-induced outer membrane protein YdiY